MKQVNAQWTLLLLALTPLVNCRRESPASEVVVEYPERYYGPHPSTWLPRGMHCANLVPEALRARFFPGARMVERPEMPSQVTCRLSDRPLHREVRFICRDGQTGPDSLERTKDWYGDVAGGQAVPGVGKLALAWETSEVRFWDDDTNCSVCVLWLDGGPQTISFARALASHLSPTTLAK